MRIWDQQWCAYAPVLDQPVFFLASFEVFWHGKISIQRLISRDNRL